MRDYVYIYGLKDPQDGKYHYVGKAVKPEARLREHLRDKTNGAKRDWLAGLKAAGLAPIVDVLQCVSKQEWETAEKHWIAEGRKSGWPLTNIANGGQGHGNEPSTQFLEHLFTEHEQGQFRGLPWETRVAIGMRAAADLVPSLLNLTATYVKGDKGNGISLRAVVASAQSARQALNEALVASNRLSIVAGR